MKIRLVALTLTVLAVVACGGRVKTSQPAEAEVISQEATPVNTAVAVAEDRSVLVERSEQVDAISVMNDFTEPVTGNGQDLMIVYVTIENTGEAFGSIFGTQFRLVDSDGREYDPIQNLEEAVTINMWLDKRDLEHSSARLFPGSTVQTAKIFRVAPDASELKLLANEIMMDIN
ncbi:MAG: DUF4352 domain-containing protein [Leptolyngbya sp. SIO1E4]|nr:DUF4352 domain-containing protein [Leptolyngbya sp. SIO1E4]